MEDIHGDRVTLCADGKYRWVYEFPMLRNPTLLFTVWKVLAIAGLVPALITVLSDIGRNGARAFLTGLQMWGVMLGITGAVAVIAYLIVAAGYGWKYIVLFEMDEEGILHAQQKKQVSKAKAMGIVTALAGAAAGKPQVAGAGLLSTTHTSLRSTFSRVKSVKGYRSRETIKLDEPFAKNQVYVSDADYDFVWDYITHHCPNAQLRA